MAAGFARAAAVMAHFRAACRSCCNRSRMVVAISSWVRFGRPDQPQTEGKLVASTRTNCCIQSRDTRRRARANPVSDAAKPVSGRGTKDALATSHQDMFRPPGSAPDTQLDNTSSTLLTTSGVPMFVRILGVTVGACLAVASPLASPARDHELLIELASRELMRCQDELAKLQQFTQATENSEVKAMGDQARAIAEAECEKLKRAIDNAAQTDRDGQSHDNPESRQSAGTSATKERQDSSSTQAGPTQNGTAREAQTDIRASPELHDESTRAAGHEQAAPKAAFARAESSGATLSIHFLAASPGATANAKTLAEQLGSQFQHTETHAEAKVPPKAVVRYATPADHTVAKNIARILASRGYTWRLEMHTTMQSDAALHTVDIWLPSDKESIPTELTEIPGAAHSGRHHGERER